MQSSVEFRDPFYYSNGIVILLIIIILILLFVLFHPKKKKLSQKVVSKPVRNINTIKQEYLNKLDVLKQDVLNNKINNRSAYVKLSKLIRNFIQEVTNVNVNTITLSEAKKLKLPYLEELMRDYYNPEFAYLENGNIEESIERTKEVIRIWK